MAGATGPGHIAPELTAPAAPAAADYPHTRWNFVVIVADASAFIAGLAFASPLVVLPLFVEHLTGSTVLVGVLAALQAAGWCLPQLLTASLVEHQERKKPLMLKACLIGRTPMILIPVTLLFADDARLTLAAFLVLNALFYLSDGVTGVPWTDICAKTIPPRLRGRFFGAMQLVGGVLSVAAGVAVREILGHPRLPYPRNFAVLFGIQSALLMVSLAFLALIREPVRPVQRQARGLVQLLREAPALLRANPQFVRMLLVAGLAWGGAIAAPFYALYAKERLAVPEATAGVFVSAQMAGGIASSLVWGLLSDRWGSKYVIQGTTLCGLAAPLFALLAPLALRPHGAQVTAYGYAFTFFLLGAVANGSWIGYTNFTLETVGEQNRPSYIALLYSLSGPLVVAPVLGGWLVRATSYQTTFAIAAVFAALATLASTSLREPRENVVAAHRRG